MSKNKNQKKDKVVPVSSTPPPSSSNYRQPNNSLPESYQRQSVTQRNPKQSQYSNKPKKEKKTNRTTMVDREDDVDDQHELTQIRHDGQVKSIDGGEPKKAITIDDAVENLGMGMFQYRILFAAGLCFAADSMEVLLLSFLSVVLKAVWDLSDEQTATITSSVFIGALLGTLVLGYLGDLIGRKPVFTLTAGIICISGFLTAVANNFWTLLAFRFFVGFGVGGLTVPFDTLAEFVPNSHRGSNLLLIEYFWTAGTLCKWRALEMAKNCWMRKEWNMHLVRIFVLMQRPSVFLFTTTITTVVPVLAFFSFGDKEGEQEEDWRIFVVLCGVPCFLSCIASMLYVPESPRWLLTQGKHEEALFVLRKAATLNGKNPDELFPMDTVIINEEEESENFTDLFQPKWRKTIIMLWSK